MTQWSSKRHLYALVGYACAAVVLSWPVPLPLSTHLTGSPAGDTGVYVWNQWVFRHELLVNRSLPYFTDSIFAITGRANLSLHNYTTFQNLLALPLIGLLGVVATFNIVYLLMTVLTAYTTFLLARHVTGRDAESWLAGLLFAWSPNLVTRGTAHFSLVAAAPLALFVLLLLRAANRERLRDAFALGATMWWAASTDVYFAVYCLIIAAVFILARVVTVERRSFVPVRRSVPWTLDLLLLCVGGLMLAMLVSGGWEFRILGRLTRVRTLYTPMLFFTILCVARAAWTYRAAFSRVTRNDAWRLVRATSVAGVVAAAMLSPVLYAIGVRIADDQWESARVFWRSSPGGIDALSFILPNPNHPLAPAAIGAWLTPRPDAYAENVASLTFVALAVIAIAWRSGWRVPRTWTALGVTFGALALGPFVQIAGVNTFVPGPWALLRYVALVGLARTPGRFSIVLMLVVAVLFASALTWLGDRWPRRRRVIVAVVTALLVFELLPVPRVLYSAEVPAIYRHVAAAPGHVRVLDLPFGMRDGTSSFGDFTARSQFFQTMHQKPLAGGYLSRIPLRRVAEARRDPMIAALMTLSEGRRLDAALEDRLALLGPPFAANRGIGFVVIDRTRASSELRDFAIRSMQLQLVDADDTFELYRPAPAGLHSSMTRFSFFDSSASSNLEELRSRVRALESLVARAPAPIAIAHDSACKVITANSALAELLGVPSDTNISLTPPAGQQPLYRIQRGGRDIPPDELPMQYAIAHRTGVSNNIEILRADGRKLYVQNDVEPLYDAQGDVCGCVSVCVDLTEHKHVEDVLRESDRRKDEFLATLAHELRNPLAPIRNALEVLRIGGGDVRQSAHAHAIMERQLHQLVRLTDDLLDVSRITRNRIDLRRERVDVRAVLQSAIETTQPLIDAAAHVLMLDAPAAPIWVHADFTRLAQAFANLLNNAVKYTPRGGRIDVHVTTSPTRATVVVRDSGVGMTPAALPRIFDMFMQSAESLDRSRGGLGIGLTLAKRLIELHGGAIDGHSEGPGLGSTFTVELPLVAPATQHPRETETPPRDVVRRRILIAEDIPDAAEMLRMMLDLMGHEVRVAADGVQAVAIAREFNPEIALLDIGMPRMDGYQAAREIREALGSRVLLVALTGWGQEEDQRRSSEAGFDHHLTKPAEPSVLETLIASARRSG